MFRRLLLFSLLMTAFASAGARGAESSPLAEEFSSTVRPLLAEYCVSCHSASKRRGSLNLELFQTLPDVRHELHEWMTMAELLEAGEMPPEGKKQPTDEQRQQLTGWLTRFLGAEAAAHAGDPGNVPLRRLSNAEYDCTIRDLTGVDLRPTKEFPADGAAGEGFTNAAESLADMSPTLLGKYLLAAKDISRHAVLLPDGLRFSRSADRRDWTNECVEKIRGFYARFTAPDGKLPLRPYLAATIAHRDDLACQKVSIATVAEQEKLSPRYLAALWEELNGGDPSYPLDLIRSRWRSATAKDVDALVNYIAKWQSAAWDPRRVGSYASLVRQAPSNPGFIPRQTLGVEYKLQPGRQFVTLSLGSACLSSSSARGSIVWKHARFEGDKVPPLSLRNIAQFGTASAVANRAFFHRPDLRFDAGDDLIVPVGESIELQLPAALVAQRQFLVDAELQPLAMGEADDRIVQLSAGQTPTPALDDWDGKSPLLTRLSTDQIAGVINGFDRFRDLFPMFVCFPHVVPTDEVVCLKQFHREDEPLVRLFLDQSQTQEIDRLWDEQRFVSQWPLSENKYLPLFIGFVTQDGSKEAVAFFEAMRDPFARRAEQFEQEMKAATPRQMAAVLRFASRAFRRPLSEEEQSALHAQFDELKSRGISDDEALRGVLSRVLVSPSFLFKIEKAPGGKDAAPVDDFELATRLSYFLWSSLPDDELRCAAASGRLHDPGVLERQTARMLKDDRVEALAIEFGTQWIHVRGFADFNEKNEKLFPTFDASLRADIDRESTLFFKDLFQNDDRVTDLLDADFTYLNEPLAQHYHIPGVHGGAWRKVEGVKKFGRGGVLGLASVLSKEAGASRTSPVLRGNWVVETLLGEKLPRPPPDVPKLPEEEGSAGLTTRQLVEKHTQSAACSVCHRRIDPIGFTFEGYDAIGRLRDRETSGLPIDCRATLKDGTPLDGIDGLRRYLLTQKRDVVIRLFCRRLLGYALGRAVVLSDNSTIDDMMSELKSHDGRMSAAVLAIVRSRQFQCIRGNDAVDP